MDDEHKKEMNDRDFNEFYSEVKEIEKRDSVLTPKQQIDRLLRPGSTYFNLNPFEVLQIEPETSSEEAKKNINDDAERAQAAFEIINKAWKTLETQETRQKCLDIIEEAKVRTDMMIADKKKKLKKEGKCTKVEEDEPSKYKHAVYVMTMKLFADLERKKRDIEERDMQERKRKREKEIEEETKASMEKEWQKNFEESREGRVNSWKAFQAGSKKSDNKVKKFKAGGFKPPKHKAESR
ncbi:conserved hypothetical protein [Pediculus humanus corporis]|uniref:Uncharacterized protein n=1 Tax=Pediculus humanus subsp. corporis TaxID=121224 RepID=E0VI69_PEDHC|nr:uncharacterized protein Phum_PHUM221290 [Pediculus humanus corporis]EEB13075.1 conserved hypothetical protein [Pediculus humanus corporis]